MIHNQLIDIGTINVFRSDRVFYALVEGLVDAYGSFGHEYHDALKSAIRDFYPSRFRKDAIEDIYEYNAKEPMCTLDRLYDEYLSNGRDGSYVFADIEKLERYSALITKIDPFNILGRRMAKDWIEGVCDFRNIQETAQVVMPLLLGAHRGSRVYADNHIHLGGANENLPNLLVLFERDTPLEYYDKQWNSQLPRLSEFALINSGVLTIGHLIDIGKYAMYYLHAVALGGKIDYRQEVERECLYKMRHIVRYGKVAARVNGVPNSFTLPSKYYAHHTTDEARVLAETVLAAEQERRTEQWLYYNVLLHRLYLLYGGASIVGKMVMIFLHTTNIIRSYQMMSQNVGLSHFSEFFGSKIRQTRKDRHGAVAKNIFGNGTVKVEGKISPRQIYNGDMMRYKLALDCEILKAECSAKPTAYARTFVDTLDSTISRRYQFSIHFQRKEERNDPIFTSLGRCAVRHEAWRNSLKKEAARLHRYLFESDTKEPLFNAYLGLINEGEPLLELLHHERQLKERCIDPAKMIVSLDVAGRETAAPPEVFAPVINFLRGEPKHQGWMTGASHSAFGSNPHRKLRLSVHAGEDFDHMATGMRRIDETIEFYGMHAHDRLGHALAAGIDPKQWIRRNGDVLMRKIDRLDDLVWLYFSVSEILDVFPKAAIFLHRAESAIDSLSKEIYDRDYTPRQLLLAWKMRKFCPIESARSVPIKGLDLYFRNAVKDPRPSDDIYKIFESYHINTAVRKNGDEMLRLVYKPNAECLTDTIDDLEVEMLYAVQDLLIQKIAERGIIIEANPSSNIYIAQLEGFAEHPIFRWDPVNGFDAEEKKRYNRFGIRKGRVKVCVNTDDPAIFPTTLFTEFKHLKRAAIDELGYHRPGVELWLKQLREFGSEIFDYNHQTFEFLD